MSAMKFEPVEHTSTEVLDIESDIYLSFNSITGYTGLNIRTPTVLIEFMAEEDLREELEEYVNQDHDDLTEELIEKLRSDFRFMVLCYRGNLV